MDPIFEDLLQRLTQIKENILKSDSKNLEYDTINIINETINFVKQKFTKANIFFSDEHGFYFSRIGSEENLDSLMEILCQILSSIKFSSHWILSQVSGEFLVRLMFLCIPFVSRDFSREFGFILARSLKYFHTPLQELVLGLFSSYLIPFQILCFTKSNQFELANYYCLTFLTLIFDLGNFELKHCLSVVEAFMPFPAACVLENLLSLASCCRENSRTNVLKCIIHLFSGVDPSEVLRFQNDVCGSSSCSGQQRGKIKVVCLDHRFGIETDKLIPPVFLCEDCASKMPTNYIHTDYYQPLMNKFIIIKNFKNFSKLFVACQMSNCNEIADFLCYFTKKNQGVYICKNCNSRTQHDNCYRLLSPYSLDQGVDEIQSSVDNNCLKIIEFLHRCVHSFSKELDIFSDISNVSPFQLLAIQNTALAFNISSHLLRHKFNDNEIISRFAFSKDFSPLAIRALVDISMNTLIACEHMKELSELRQVLSIISSSAMKLVGCIEVLYQEYFNEFIYPAIEKVQSRDPFKYATRILYAVSLLFQNSDSNFDWWEDWFISLLTFLVTNTSDIRYSLLNDFFNKKITPPVTLSVFKSKLVKHIQTAVERFKNQQLTMDLVYEYFKNQKTTENKIGSLGFLTALTYGKTILNIRRLTIFLIYFLSFFEQKCDQFDFKPHSLLFFPHNFTFQCALCNSLPIIKLDETPKITSCCKTYQNMSIIPESDKDHNRTFVSYVIIDLLLQQFRLLEISLKEKFYISNDSIQEFLLFIYNCTHFYTSGSKLPKALPQCSLFFSTITQLCSLLKKYSTNPESVEKIETTIPPIFLKLDKKTDVGILLNDLQNDTMKAFPGGVKLALLVSQLLLTAPDMNTHECLTLNQTLLTLFNFLVNELMIFDYFKMSKISSPFYKKLLEKMIIPCFFRTLNENNIDSSIVATSTLHTITGSIIGYSSYAEFLHQSSQEIMSRIESNEFEKTKNFPPKNNLKFLEQLTVYISISCKQTEKVFSVYTEESILISLFTLILFTNSKQRLEAVTANEYIKSIVPIHQKFLYEFITKHLIHIKIDQILIFLFLNELKDIWEYKPDIPMVKNWVESFFGSSQSQNPLYSSVPVLSGHSLFSSIKLMSPNTNFKTIFSVDKWDQSNYINQNTGYNIISSIDLNPPLNILALSARGTSSHTAEKLFALVCDYSIFVTKTYYELESNIELLVEYISKIIEIGLSFEFSKEIALKLPVSLHPFAILLNMLMRILDKYVPIGKEVINDSINVILIIFQKVFTDDRNVCNPSFSIVNKDIQISILKTLLVMLYKYPSQGEKMDFLMERILDSLDGHIHVCYGEITLGPSFRQLFEQKLLLKNIGAGRDQTNEQSSPIDKIKEKTKSKIQEDIQIHNCLEGNCSICSIDIIHLSNETINLCIMVMLEYLVHHVHASFNIISRAIRIVYKFIIYDRNCVACPTGNGNILSFPILSTSLTAARFYYSLINKLEPLKLFPQILKLQLHEPNYIIMAITFSLLYFESEKKFVELLEDVVGEISKNKSLYFESLQSIVVNLTEVFSCADLLLYSEKSSAHAAWNWTLCQIIQTNFQLFEDESEESPTDGQVSAKKTSLKEKLIRSFDSFSELITGTSGIFDIATDKTTNYFKTIVKFSGSVCEQLKGANKLCKKIIQAQNSNMYQLFEIASMWYGQCKTYQKTSLIEFLIEQLVKSICGIAPYKINFIVLNRISIILKIFGSSIFDVWNITDIQNEAIDLTGSLTKLLPKFFGAYMEMFYKSVKNLQGDEKKYMYLIINEDQVIRRKKIIGIYVLGISQLIALIITRADELGQPLQNKYLKDWIKTAINFGDQETSLAGNEDLRTLFDNLRTTLFIVLGAISHEIKFSGESKRFPPLKSSDIKGIAEHILTIIRVSVNEKSMSFSLRLLDNALRFSEIITLYSLTIAQSSQRQKENEESFSVLGFWMRVVKAIPHDGESDNMQTSIYSIYYERMSLLYDSLTILKLMGCKKIMSIYGILGKNFAIYENIAQTQPAFDEKMDIIPLICLRDNNQTKITQEFLCICLQEFISQGSSLIS